jgi:hypothetical protein
VLLPAAVIVAGPVAAWLVIEDRGWQTPWVLAAMGLALTASMALAGVVEREVTRRRTVSVEAPVPSGLTEELRERWRALLLADVIRTRVGERGQLAKMVRHGDPIELKAQCVDLDEGRPRVRVAGRLLPWSEITRRWDAGLGRLVILGDPGYGKTVAALTLIKHINARSQPGDRVAELFALSEWQRWRGEHQSAPFGEWLAAQLTLMHPQLDAAVARELVHAGLVLPVLDGLDEIVLIEHRRACVAAIDAYAGRGLPHRPFVLTCRAREYYELAPDWVRDDERVVLVGLQPDQIYDKLAEPQIAGRPAWRALREQQAAGDSTINELFRSPLRLTIALQVYRDRDPTELLELSRAQAHGRLWELFVQTNAGTYPGATSAHVRAWLTWLAVGLRRTGRQRFMLHELYLLDPRPATTFRSFRVAIALISGLIGGVLGWPVVWLIAAPIIGVFGSPDIRLIGGVIIVVVPEWSTIWLVGSAIVGTLGALLFGLLLDPAPSVRSSVSWRARMRYAIHNNLAGWLGGWLIIGLGGAASGAAVGSVFVGLTIGLVIGLFGALSSILFDLAKAGTDIVVADPPPRFAHAHPSAVLLASRTSGLVGSLVGGLGVGLLFGLSIGVAVGVLEGLRAALSLGLFFGLTVWLLFGLIGGLTSGLGAWLYHYWLRWRLRARGLLPPSLPAFLEWCADDERSWIRISDAYEFRHRELLEHLAPKTTPC